MRRARPERSRVERGHGPGTVRLLALAPLLVAFLLVGDLGMIAAFPTRAPACPAGSALVMGAAQYDGRPSPAFERRLARAHELWRDGCVDRIVVSGGGREGDRTTEGASGVAWLAARGVPRAALVAEETARTSAENVLRSRPHLPRGRVVIVTDDLHARRATWLAERFGLEAQVATVPVREGRLRYAARELAAMASYRLGLVR